jgi:hypothetical protein
MIVPSFVKTEASFCKRESKCLLIHCLPQYAASTLLADVPIEDQSRIA